MRKKLLGFVALSFLFPSLAHAELPCATLEQGDRYPISADALLEISGMALSHTNANYYWAHTDSSSDPQAGAVLHLIQKDGTIVHTFAIENATNIDWEDIAVGPCEPGSKQSCIYIGDMGDNLFKRTDKVIYVVEEPKIPEDLDANPLPKSLKLKETLPIRYNSVLDETEPRYTNPDCESLMVSPNAEIYFVTKQSTTGAQSLYQVNRLGKKAGQADLLASHTFEDTCALAIAGDKYAQLCNAVTGADFAPNGQRFAVRTYGTLYEFDLTVHKSMAEAFVNPTKLFALSDFQGESVAYMENGQDFIISNEKLTVSSLSIVPAINILTCIPPATDPTDPETPTDPTDPETPTDPTDPETPTDPTDPETPTDPTDPETPTDPTDPETPTDPTDPETPTHSEGACSAHPYQTHSPWTFFGLILMISGLIYRTRIRKTA